MMKRNTEENIWERPLYAEGSGSTKILRERNFAYFRNRKEGHVTCGPAGKPQVGRKEAIGEG